MFDRDPGDWNEGCGGGAGTWRRLAGRPARADLERRLTFLESADRQERDWMSVGVTSRLAWRRAIRKWKDLGGATAGACQKARAFQVAGRKKEDKEWRARVGGARTYVTNGVWRVEGIRAQQRREQAARRGRARSVWLRQRRAAEVGRRAAARETERAYKARRLARLTESAAERSGPMRKDVAVWESVRERDLAAVRRKRDERAEVQHAQRWAKRWGESLPRECEGAGSARARGMVLRARIWEGVEGREEEGEGQGRGGPRAKWLEHALGVAARQKSTH